MADTASSSLSSSRWEAEPLILMPASVSGRRLLSTEIAPTFVLGLAYEVTTSREREEVLTTYSNETEKITGAITLCISS